MTLGPATKTFLTFLSILAAFLLFWQSGLLGVDLEYIRSFRDSPWLPAIMILAMTGAWTFAIPASAFFFFVPLFYSPLESAAIVTTGCITGSLGGYIAARTLAADRLEKYRSHKVTQFLSRNAHFAALFAIRIVPASPHMFINYAAGLLRVPPARFIATTALATAIKSFIYALAVHSAVGAESIADVLTWESVAALFGMAGLALIGRWVRRKLFEAGS